MENQQYKWRQRKKRNGYIAIWIIVVILLSVIGTFVYDGMQSSDPLKVAGKYFRQAENIEDYTVETGERSLNSDNQFVQEYTFNYTADGKELSKTVNLVQQDAKKYGLFEQWDVTGEKTGETKIVQVIAPKSSQVLINSIAPDADQVMEDPELSGSMVHYVLTVPVEECKIQVNGLPFDSYEGTLDGVADVVDLRDRLVIGENAQTQMTELAKTMINQLFTAAVANNGAAQLGSNFDHAANKENLYKAIVSNLYKGDDLQLTSLTFEGFKPEFGEVYYSGKDEEGYIGMDMKLAYTCKYVPAASTASADKDDDQTVVEEGEETEEQTETEAPAQTEQTVAKEASFTFRYQDGKCTVTAIEVPGVL